MKNTENESVTKYLVHLFLLNLMSKRHSEATQDSLKLRRINKKYLPENMAGPKKYRDQTNKFDGRRHTQIRHLG